MARSTLDCEELARRGQEYYDRFLRATVEPEHKGEFLVLDVETGEYELDASEAAALDRAMERHPDRLFYILRVGSRAAHRIGARFARSEPS
jgi:hypothetical protein